MNFGQSRIFLTHSRAESVIALGKGGYMAIKNELLAVQGREKKFCENGVFLLGLAMGNNIKQAKLRILFFLRCSL